VAAGIRGLCDKLYKMMAAINASLDFPEEVEPVPAEDLKRDLLLLLKEIDNVARAGRRGQLFRQGILVPIVGKPNVGKSTLLNRWLGEERAIISSEPGTTRDWLEGQVTVEGIPIRLVDTAGWRKAHNEVEKIGVDSAERLIEQADILIFVGDLSRPWDQDDKKLWKLCAAKPKLVLLNKADLPAKLSLTEEVRAVQPQAMSLSKQDNILKLQDMLLDKVLAGDRFSAKDCLFVSDRQQEKLANSKEHLNSAMLALEQGLSADCLSADLKLALQELGEITGEAVSEEIVEHIFADFCVGK
jgi:tRNA modification GTPase